MHGKGRIVSHSPLFMRMVREAGIETFVETGTFQGHTAKWAKNRFRNVYTCELSDDLYREMQGIKTFHGSSFDFLTSILPKVGTSLFWLDAHWGGGKQKEAGSDNQCALLDELKLIRESGNEDHIIMIDDARLFEMVPPSFLNEDQWPSLFDICKEANKWSTPRFLQILGDVIYITPLELRRFFLEIRDNHEFRQMHSKYVWGIQRKY